jgi:hypothetical protein
MRLRAVGWWVVVAAVLLLSTPAWAHIDANAVVPVPAATTALIPAPLADTPSAAALASDAYWAAGSAADAVWILVTAAAVALALARRRRRVALACVVVLLLMAFESGVHSVHHLADRPDAHCVIAAVSAHTGGVTVDTVAFEPPSDVVSVVSPSSPAGIARRSDSPDRGRAPPSA